jgi:hypothetical protein
VRLLWAKNMDAAKDIHKEMLPMGSYFCFFFGDSRFLFNTFTSGFI